VRKTVVQWLGDESALARAYGRMRKDAAVGVDGITKEQYGHDLEKNLRDLHERLKSKRYRHQHIRRVHIPKDGGKTRPIGISAMLKRLPLPRPRIGCGFRVTRSNAVVHGGPWEVAMVEEGARGRAVLTDPRNRLLWARGIETPCGVLFS
jgi:hypothetical protein